jgi:hypothetical protein
MEAAALELERFTEGSSGLWHTNPDICFARVLNLGSPKRALKAWLSCYYRKGFANRFRYSGRICYG